MDPEYNPFILSYKLIIDILPYKAALKLGLLNRYCWRIFTSKRKELKLIEDCGGTGFNDFVASLGVVNLRVNFNEAVIFISVYDFHSCYFL